MNLSGFQIIILIFFIRDVLTLSKRDIKYKQLVRGITPEDSDHLDHLADDENAEEFSGQFQGDMVLSPQQMKIYENKNRLRNGLLQKTFLWPKGVVPVKIDTKSFRKDQITEIKKAMKIIEHYSCVRFHKYSRKKHESFITINSKQKGCWSFVGRQGGEQTINFQSNFKPGKGCFRLYTLVHELLHALGFMHMQSASNRDDFVKIIHENVQPGLENNFMKFGADIVSNYDVEYDYGSVMHYTANSFSKNGEDTIVPLQKLPRGLVLGQRERLSDKDITKLRRMYSCGEGKVFGEIIGISGAIGDLWGSNLNGTELNRKVNKLG